jgi:hypothetical protein
MKIEKKEIVVIWGAIIVVLYVLTRAVYSFFMKVIFDYLSGYFGPSLASALFWVGWILVLIKVFDIVIKWCIFSDDI